MCRQAGFTLLEACATLFVLMLVLGALEQVTASVSQSWRSAASDPFSETAMAFETVTQSLGRATLESYEDYADAGGSFRTSSSAPFTPDHLARRSDLAFACGPASGLLASSGRTTASGSVFFVEPAGETQLYAQEGLDHLLNARGYFVAFGADANAPGFFSGSARLRWRLEQVEQSSEALQIFATTASSPWIQQLTGSSGTPAILAENVIALVILPERAAADASPAPLAPAFSYDSRDATNTLTFGQLPPRVRVVLAAIDEASAQRLAEENGQTAPGLILHGLFLDSSKLDADVATLDASLTAGQIRHRIFQRDLSLVASAWSNTP